MGHEFGGTILEVGEGVDYLRPDQRAAVHPTIFDKTCGTSKQGCENCYSVNDELAELVEPLAIAWYEVKNSAFKSKDNVPVLGGRPIGIAIVQVLKLRGAKTIITVEPEAKRSDLSKHFGATHVLDPRQVDVPQEVHKITNGLIRLGEHAISPIYFYP
ncbi:chaperonin 10-like protein [Penicillium macrosclerotiorum]|uniref:chaperonin 10-like protein n=1 Tax=Penicillium macrosclerotiorum TaxID=303699 RepID=UPI0025479E9C|nr:chaperonin 10-like protein [Penicillium macrosclerotiorum]KAJ5682711.1 chaperonin 10-like protein [Penicillium macrosclerotiorum]